MAEPRSSTAAGKGRGRGESVSGVHMPPADDGAEKNSVVIKVGMVGDSQIGKTSLMVRYVEGSFECVLRCLARARGGSGALTLPSPSATGAATTTSRRWVRHLELFAPARCSPGRLTGALPLASRTGVNFMEKTISIRNTEITFSVRDPPPARACARAG